MSADNDDAFEAYQQDSRIACQYGAKCYQKNPLHRNKYKHPPKREKVDIKKVPELFTGKKRKNDDRDNAVQLTCEQARTKLQKVNAVGSDRDLHTLSSNSGSSPDISDTEDSKDVKEKAEDCSKSETLDATKESSQMPLQLPNTENSDDNEFVIINPDNMRSVISDLFLVEMPDDFYQFYEFCKSISENDPSAAFKTVQLELVGPFDVLTGIIKRYKVTDKERFLCHWRYYYDPPEYQTVIKCNDKDGLHFGYWRDDASERPVFAAKNRVNVNSVIEPVAANIFGAINVYLEGKVKTANPFNKAGIARLQRQVKNFANENNITLDKTTSEMQDREKKVVARTFHKAGIVVPYNKRTQVGYRELAVTDNILRQILNRIGEAGSSEERKRPLIELEEIVRLATIAADECDFGTCLELAHDIFASGVVYVQNIALQMFSTAYTLLQRPQLLEIVKAHLSNRRKGTDLSVI